MRRFVLLLVLLSLLSVLDASVLYVSRKSFGFDSEKVSFSMDYGNLSFSYKGFSTGDIGDRGLVRTLSNLHSYSDFVPKTDKFNKREQKRGFMFDGGVLKLFYLKNIIGFESSIGPCDLFYIFKTKEKIAPSAFIDFKDSREKDVMYFGARFALSAFSISGITSFDDNGNFFSFLGTRFEYWGSYVDIRLGNIFPLFPREEYDLFSIALGLERDEGEMSWKIAYGSEPIYTNTYMVRKSAKSIVVELGSAKLESKSEVRFLSDGRYEKSDKIAFVHDFISIHYDSNSGLRHRISFEYATLTVGRESVGIVFDFPFSRGPLKVELELRGLSGFDVNISIELP